LYDETISDFRAEARALPSEFEFRLFRLRFSAAVLEIMAHRERLMERG
jgi:hypothetical protein